MASAFQPSEGFYAALQFHPNLNTAGSNFMELHQWSLATFMDDSKVEGTNKGGFLREMTTADRNEKDRKRILGSLAAAYNGVMHTRSGTPFSSMPDKVYMTGGTWPQKVQKFKLDHFGMADFNSSDVIMEYSSGKYGNKPHWVGVPLKEKEREGAANPPLINNAFSNYIKDEEKPSLIVMLSHNGVDVDKKMASKVSGIDVILGGHTHDVLPKPVIVQNNTTSTLVINSGCNGKFVSVLDLIFRGKSFSYKYKLLPVLSNQIKPSQMMNSLINNLKEVNKNLWEIEDRIRIKDSKIEFDQEFIDLALSLIHI